MVLTHEYCWTHFTLKRMYIPGTNKVKGKNFSLHLNYITVTRSIPASVIGYIIHTKVNIKNIQIHHNRKIVTITRISGR